MRNFKKTTLILFFILLIISSISALVLHFDKTANILRNLISSNVVEVLSIIADIISVSLFMINLIMFVLRKIFPADKNEKPIFIAKEPNYSGADRIKNAMIKEEFEQNESFFPFTLQNTSNNHQYKIRGIKYRFKFIKCKNSNLWIDPFGFVKINFQIKNVKYTTRKKYYLVVEDIKKHTYKIPLKFDRTASLIS